MFDQLFNQFVVAFREGIEASLIIMTVMMALKKRGEVKLQRAAVAGIWTAIVTCIVGGYLLGSVALVNSHGVELALYLAAAITVTTMVFWMMRTGRKLKGNIETKFNDYNKDRGFLPLLGIFAFVFFMIAREGFEMVLLLLAFGAGIGGHYYVTAMLMGIGCAVLFSYALSKGMMKINLGKFLQSTAFVLLLFVVQLIFSVLNEANEGGFVTYPSQSFTNFVDYIGDQVPVFSYIGLALFMVLVVYYFGTAVKNRSKVPASSTSSSSLPKPHSTMHA